MWKNYQHLKSGHWQKSVTGIVRTARTLCGNLRTCCYMCVTSRPITGRVRILVRILPVRYFAVHSSHITNRRKTLALRANMTGVGMKNSIQRYVFCPRRTESNTDRLVNTTDQDSCRLLLSRTGNNVTAWYMGQRAVHGNSLGAKSWVPCCGYWVAFDKFRKQPDPDHAPLLWIVNFHFKWK